MRTATLKIEGLRCASCAASVGSPGFEASEGRA